MKKILFITIIVIGLAGYVYYRGTTSQNTDPVAAVPQAPSNNIGGDVNVCVGSAKYCGGLVDTEQQALEYQNEQFKLQLTAMAPTLVPTPSPNDLILQQREHEAKTNVIVVALYALVVIGIIAGLCWIVWQMYWNFMIRGPRDEKAVDIKESKDGQLIVARLPGDLNHADGRDQWIALDRKAMGAQLIHIDGNGIAHKLALSDDAVKYVAMANAISDAASRDQAKVFMQQLLDQWTRNANTTIQTLGEAASKWKGSGRRNQTQVVPSKMRRLEKGESVTNDGSQAGASVTWEGVKKDK